MLKSRNNSPEILGNHPVSTSARLAALGQSADPSISYADQYPGVPRPEPILSPLILAAQWTCRDLRCEDMPPVAADLQASGLDTPSMRRLAALSSVNCSADVEPLAARMFRELSVPYPLTMKQAKLIYTRQLSREVIHGKANAWVAANCARFQEWSWRRVIQGLWAISFLNEEFESINGRPTTILTAELLDTFARLALLKDRDYLSEVA
jgi:hypothetical protein